MNWKHLIGWLIDYGSKVLDKKYGMTIKSEFVFSFRNVSRILMISTKCYIFESDTDNTNKDLCKTIRVDEVKFGLYRKVFQIYVHYFEVKVNFSYLPSTKQTSIYPNHMDFKIKKIQ